MNITYLYEISHCTSLSNIFGLLRKHKLYHKSNRYATNFPYVSINDFNFTFQVRLVDFTEVIFQHNLKYYEVKSSNIQA